MSRTACLIILLIGLLVPCLADNHDSTNEDEQQGEQTSGTGKELDVALNEGLEPFFEMTHIFLDHIQSQNVTEEIDKKIGVANFNDYDQITEDLIDSEFVRKHLTGYVACVAVGVLFILVMIFTCIIMPCCRCCGNCGGSRNPMEGKRDSFWRCCCGTALLLLNTAMLAWVVCAFITNEMLRKQTDVGEDGMIPQIQEGLNTLELYSQTAIDDVEESIIEAVGDAMDELIRQLEGVPAEAAQGIADELHTDELLQQLRQLNASTQAISTGLQEIKDMSEELQTNMDTLVNRIDTFKTQTGTVLGDCSGLAGTSCDSTAQTIEDLNNDADFDQLPSVDSQLGSVAAVLDNDFAENVKAAHDDIDKIVDRVNNETSVTVANHVDQIIAEVENERGNIENQANDIYNDIKTDTIDAMNVTKAQDKASENEEKLEEYGRYRWIVGLVICCLILLVVVFYFLGLLCGFCGEPAYPDAGTCNRGAGAKLMLAGVAFTLIFSWIIMLVTIVLFVIGGVMDTEVCRYIVDIENDPSVDILMKPTISDLKLNFSLSITDTFRMCKNNTAIFTALDLGQIINLDQLDIAEYEIDQYILDLNDADISLSDITITPGDLTTQLDNLSEAGLDDIDFDEFRTQIAADITNGNLEELKQELEELRDEVQPVDDGKATEIQELIDSLEEIRTIEQEMRTNSGELGTKVTEVSALINGADGDVDFRNQVSTLKTSLTDTQAELQNNGVTVINAALNKTAHGLLAGATAGMNSIINSVKYDIAKCEPVYEAATHIIDTVCYAVLDPWNGFWASIGWCLLLMIPNMIIALKLENLYRKYEDYDPSYDHKSFEDPNFDHYTGTAAPHGIPLEELPYNVRAPKSYSGGASPHQANYPYTAGTPSGAGGGASGSGGGGGGGVSGGGGGPQHYQGQYYQQPSYASQPSYTSQHGYYDNQNQYPKNSPPPHYSRNY